MDSQFHWLGRRVGILDVKSQPNKSTATTVCFKQVQLDLIAQQDVFQLHEHSIGILQGTVPRRGEDLAPRLAELNRSSRDSRHSAIPANVISIVFGKH